MNEPQKLTPTEAKQIFGEIIDRLDRFEENPASIEAISQNNWELVGRRVMLFSTIKARAEERKQIDGECSVQGLPTAEDLREDATQEQNWVCPLGRYSAKDAQLYSHKCCRCPNLLDDDGYYRLKRCRVYLCNSCYAIYDAAGFAGLKEVVGRYLVGHQCAIPTMSMSE